MTPRLERYVREHMGEQALVTLRAWRIPYEDDPPSERLLAAAAFYPDGLQAAIDLADRDWRDLLVASGLAYEDWPQILDERLG